MPHAKKFLAVLIASIAFSACMDDVDVTPDETADPGPIDPSTGQVFPETGYTKIGNDGIILADQTQAWTDNGSEATGTQWSCVRDNETGLYWEVKTNDGGLRDGSWQYTWYDTNPETNGGDWGIGDTGEYTTTGFENFTGSTNGTDTPSESYPGSDKCFDSARCDTEKYMSDVNEAQLCGFNDWRLPTGNGEQDNAPSAQELQSLLNCQGFSYTSSEETDSDCSFVNSPLIDINYFPNTIGDLSYWSSSPYANNIALAWFVGFRDGGTAYIFKDFNLAIRLVRANQ